MDLDSPSVLIPASSFPHLIDSIISFASPSVLVAFRNTCTEYRARITEDAVADSLQSQNNDGNPGLHLHLEVNRVPDNNINRYPCPSHEHKLVATFPTLHGPCPAPTFLASRVRIVTLHAGDLDGDFGVMVPAARLLDNVSIDVVRITDFEGATAKILFKAPKYVLFMNADNGDDDEDEGDDDENEDEQMDLDYLPLPSNSNSSGLPLNSGSWSGGSLNAEDFALDTIMEPASPFPDNVTEVVCNIACSPSAGCTNLTRSQLSALNLGHRGILSNLIYIFRPILEDNSRPTRGCHESSMADGKPRGKGKDKAKDKDGATSRRASRSRSSSPAAPTSSLPGSPPESPAVVPFLDNQLACFPSPDFTIVGCENLRYWADPESTLFARFASIMNAYCDFEINMSGLQPLHGAGAGGQGQPDVQVEVALGFDLGGDDLDRSRYFKSFPQWTASHARSAPARAWYELMTVP